MYGLYSPMRSRLPSRRGRAAASACSQQENTASLSVLDGRVSITARVSPDAASMRIVVPPFPRRKRTVERSYTTIDSMGVPMSSIVSVATDGDTPRQGYSSNVQAQCAK